MRSSRALATGTLLCLAATLATAQTTASSSAHPVPEFTPSTISHTGMYASPQRVIQGDLNRDAVPDLLLGTGYTLDYHFYTAVANGDGSFRTAVAHATPYAPAAPLAVGDFNRDGKLDVLVGSAGYSFKGGAAPPTVTLFYGDGQGGFTGSRSFTTGDITYAAVAGNFLRNGKLDAMLLTGTTMQFIYGDGGGGLVSPKTVVADIGCSGFSCGNDLVIGDFDGDGNPDAATLQFDGSNTTTLSVAYGDGHGDFTVRQYTYPGQIIDISTADLNRDGRTDILATLNPYVSPDPNPPTLELFYGQADRTFVHTSSANVSSPSTPGSIQFLDFPVAAQFSANGTYDIGFVANSGSEIDFLSGNGAGTVFSPYGPADNAYPVQGGTGFTPLLAGDYNRDGKLDVLAVTSDGAVDFFKNITPNTPACAAIFNSVHLCSPASSSGASVHVYAAGDTVSGTTYMDVLVDGVRRYAIANNYVFTTLTLAKGTHQLTVDAYDLSGYHVAASRTVTVQ